jgi:hypothetical protein
MVMLLPEDRASQESAILARIRRGKRVDHFGTTRVRKDGTNIFVSVTISPIKDNRGVIVGASKIARDITEHKGTQEALRQGDATRGQLRWQRLKPMEKLARMLLDHLQGILNYLLLKAQRLAATKTEFLVLQKAA